MSARRAPWFENASPRTLPAGARIAIIGGGIAGASLAHEARRAGFAATIFDPEGLAKGASGNPAGLIMPRLDLGQSAAASFFLAAYLHVLQLLEAAPEAVFNPCGVMLAAGDAAGEERLWRLFKECALPGGWMERRGGGLFLPQAGVVDPCALVRMLAEESEVVHDRIIAVDAAPDHVRLFLESGKRLDADAAVIANGVDALRFVQARSLPLAPVAGQIDWFESAEAPAHAVAFGPYVAPAPRGGVFIGATYDKSGAACVSLAATQANIDALASRFPQLAAQLDPKASQPRAGVRCQTPDRLPVAGAVPDLGFYSGAYDDLRFGRKADYPEGQAHPGLYILAGLGSRGLVTAPLCAAMIVAEMTGEIAPVGDDIAQALHPARFFIRDLKRAQKLRK